MWRRASNWSENTKAQPLAMMTEHSCLTKYTLVVCTLPDNCKLKSLVRKRRWFWKMECVGNHSNEKGVWSIVQKGYSGIERWTRIRKMVWLRLFECPLDFVNGHCSLSPSISPFCRWLKNQKKFETRASSQWSHMADITECLNILYEEGNWALAR